MHTTTDYIKPFKKLGLRDLALVGGKNASLGEMYQNLRSSGINVPDGFATTAQAYREFLNYNQLKTPLREYLLQLDTDKFSNLSQVGSSIRALFLQAEMPPALEEAIGHGYKQLTDQYGAGLTVAARSSATAEDLPEASFAGQQETFLNISLESELIAACRKCFASLFTDRAIKYRQDLGFDHMMVALSVGVQLMVRADTGCSGVIFTLDPESGHEEIIHVAGVWGIGENIVQGTVNPDEFYVFKPSLEQGKYPIIQRKLGSKNKTMQYAPAPEQGLVNVDTPLKKQQQFVLTDDEVVTLAQWAGIIEKHYGRPMDIEWAKDGLSQELFILQARPETVYSQKDPSAQLVAYKLLEKGQELCRGSGLGNRIAKGQVKVLHSPREASKLQQGDILVTTITNPDWDPILRKVGAIITDQGGRTSHAAIVARELGTVAVVGTGNASQVLNDNQQVTVSCAQGSTGMIYDGYLQWEEQTVDIGSLPQPRTKPLLILGDPQQAFRLAAFPAQGVGLMRLEFVINNSVRVHPLALKYFEQVEDAEARTIIEDLCVNHPRKEEYFVQKLAEGIATIAAAFYPREVIVRTSDFKTNEYANLVGGRYFEPHESNPMLGFRGASRYYHPRYREGFAMECQALKFVREDMGLHNVKIMIPFCRSLQEAQQVLNIMEAEGLQRGEQGLEIYMMVEIPSNVILAREFAQYFDGFSIGSNDLTQLTLGVDRDSELLTEVFDVNDAAVKRMISMVLQSAKETGTTIGLCGQAPSDYPEFAQFLVDEGIDSISFNADALIDGIKNINAAEDKLRAIHN